MQWISEPGFSDAGEEHNVYSQGTVRTVWSVESWIWSDDSQTQLINQQHIWTTVDQHIPDGWYHGFPVADYSDEEWIYYQQLCDDS